MSSGPVTTRRPSESAVSRSVMFTPFRFQKILCKASRSGWRPMAGSDDWLIAGAATEIALDGALDFGFGRLRIAHPQRIERHDETGCAESRTGCRGKSTIACWIGCKPPFCPRKCSMVTTWQPSSEARKRMAGQLTVSYFQTATGKPADQHRAGPAIAFRAAFLRAC